MSTGERGQVTGSAAEVYDQFFLPALFAQWAEPVVDAAAIQPGQRILDVACGTGAATLVAAERVGVDGAVVGIDINPGMVAVARQKSTDIDWLEGNVEALPFDDDVFDAVLCQHALMFFEDRAVALREMMRVLRPGGRLIVAVWDSLDTTPGYESMVALLQRLFGDDIANELRPPFVLGDKELLTSIYDEAGIYDIELTTLPGIARFPSIDSWVFTDIKGWTLSDLLDDEQFKLLLEEARNSLEKYQNTDGTVSFAAPAHIVVATKE